MFCALSLWQFFVTVLAVSAANPTRTKRDDPPGVISAPTGSTDTPAFNHSQFVTTQDGQFFVNGSPFRFVGTNAYWLASLNTDEDIDNTLAAIRQANFTVVRTWAFNDVDVVPENGTWFQTVVNGTLVINNGTNGLAKLDKVMEFAQKHGIYVLLSLTNNWSPIPGIDTPLPADAGPLGRRQNPANNTNMTLPRGSLSNDYGGMDFYVRNLLAKNQQQHDQFFTNDTIKAAFKNYTDAIVSRYANHSNVFAWELANDPRCNSTIPASSTCNTLNITRWHSDVAQNVKRADPNHLVSSGNQGYFCADCPKLFLPRPSPPPSPPAAPAPSPAPGKRRRKLPEAVSKTKLLQERKLMWKRERQRQKDSGELLGGVKIRGRWAAAQTKRQDDSDLGVGPSSDTVGVGPAFDGTHGVDSEDIISIPQIGFGSFQLFPDQYTYSTVVDPSLPVFNRTLMIGLDWIGRHIATGRLVNKPISLTGFGLVTQENAPFYVPFNTTVAPFAPDAVPTGNVTQPHGVTDAERDEAYRQWIQAGIEGLQGIIQYQWSQDNLTAQEGTIVSPLPSETGATPNTDSTGTSPNDGYGILGQGRAEAIGSIQPAVQAFAPDTA